MGRDRGRGLVRSQRRYAEQGDDPRGDCAHVWINAWVKESKKTGKKFSLSFKPKQERIDRSRPLRDDLDDAIPF
jgi:hypothetical protein